MPSLSDKIKAATAGDELEWIPRNNIPTQNELSALTEEFSREYGMESELQAKAKLPAWEKIKENPFVPLGKYKDKIKIYYELIGCTHLHSIIQ